MCDPMCGCTTYYFKKDKKKRAPKVNKVLYFITLGARKIEKGAEPDTSHISTGLVAFWGIKAP